MKVNLAKNSPKTIAELEHLESVCFPGASWGASNLENIFENVFKEVYFLDNGVSIIGYIILQNIYGEGEIERIGILPSERCKGVGSFLLTETIKMTGIFECTLDVDEKNISALKLYEKNGFLAVATRSSYYRNGHDAVIMKWKKGVDAVE